METGILLDERREMNIIKRICNFVSRRIIADTHYKKIHRIVLELCKQKENLIELLPDKFKYDFRNKSYIAGGCIYSIYNKQKPKDYDFLLNDNFPIDDLREYFMEQAGYHGSGMSGGTYKGLPLLITDNAISIGKYQIITRWHGKPEETIQEFDFLHNQFYWNGGTIETLSDFKHLRSDELVYNDKRARDIVGTIIRVSKFTQRGMKVKSKTVAKMLLKLHEVGFNERELEILRDTSSDKHFGS